MPGSPAQSQISIFTTPGLYKQVMMVAMIRKNQFPKLLPRFSLKRQCCAQLGHCISWLAKVIAPRFHTLNESKNNPFVTDYMLIEEHFSMIHSCPRRNSKYPFISDTYINCIYPKSLNRQTPFVFQNVIKTHKITISQEKEIICDIW